MDNPTLTYATITDLETFESSFSTKTKLEKSLLIYNAENLVDKIVWNCHEKLDKTQNRVFPTKDFLINDDIKLATLYLARNLWQSTGEKEIIEEKHWTSTYKYGNSGVSKASDYELAKGLLSNFICGKWLR